MIITQAGNINQGRLYASHKAGSPGHETQSRLLCVVNLPSPTLGLSLVRGCSVVISSE